MISFKGKKIAIVDYKMSNLFSVKHACDYVGFEAEITSNKEKVVGADAVILPGVGAFGNAMRNLKKLDLISPIKDYIESGKPFMGICLGLQLLFTESCEFGSTKGLNIIEGTVEKFPRKDSNGKKTKVPHMGWNQIYKSTQNSDNWMKSPLCSLAEGEYMYFVHSLYVIPSDQRNTSSLTNYEGMEFCSGIMKENVFAVQFHPEKSAEEGIKIYAKWGSLINKRAEK